MASPNQIILNTVKQVGDIADENILALEGVMADLERRLIADFSRITTTQGVDVALARSQVEAMLVEAGYFERVDSLVNKSFQAEIELAHGKYKALYNESFQFSADSMARLGVIKQMTFADFGGIADDMTKGIARAVIDNQFGATDKLTLISDIAKQTQKTTNQAKTIIDTATHGYYQEANNKLAEDNGFTRYVPVGPLDNKTRDFCAAQMSDPSPRTKAEIQSLDNDQGLSVLTYFGGYNCRHIWEPIRG